MDVYVKRNVQRRFAAFLFDEPYMEYRLTQDKEVEEEFMWLQVEFARRNGCENLAELVE